MARTFLRLRSDRSAFLLFNISLFVLLAALPVHAEPVFTPSIGVKFIGSTYNKDTDQFRIVPDTMGAIGPSHFVELNNGAFIIYDKSGSRVGQPKSLDNFWIETARVSFDTGRLFAGDPRVLYDPSLGRWVAASLAFDISHISTKAGVFLVAVSSSSNPTAAWTGTQISADFGPAGANRAADFTTLGVNQDAVYVAATILNPADSNKSEGTDVLIFPKNDLNKGSLANPQRFFDAFDLGNQKKVQPIVDLDNLPLAKAPEILLSARELAGDVFRRIDILTLGIGGLGRSEISSMPFKSPLPAPQEGTSTKVPTGFSNFSSSVIRQGETLWGVQSTDINGRSALQWVQIDPLANRVIQQGVISHPLLSFYYGSISVNDFGDVVIGFSGSSDTQSVSSYAVVGTKTLDGTTRFGSPILLQQGHGTLEFGRAGDYSATTLDPADPFSFWTIQEVASGTNQWSTQITQIKTRGPVFNACTFGATQDNASPPCVYQGNTAYGPSISTHLLLPLSNCGFFLDAGSAPNVGDVRTSVCESFANGTLQFGSNSFDLKNLPLHMLVKMTLDSITGNTLNFSDEVLDFEIMGLPFDGLIDLDPEFSSLGRTTLATLADGSFFMDSFFDVFTRFSFDSNGDGIRDTFFPSAAAMTLLAQGTSPVPGPASIALLTLGLTAASLICRYSDRHRHSLAKNHLRGVITSRAQACPPTGFVDWLEREEKKAS